MTKYSHFIHPNSVCMTYFQHMKFSAGLSKDMFIGSYKALIHSIFPNIYITSSGDVTKNLMNKLQRSGCNDKKD
jgi:hypothetical protein